MSNTQSRRLATVTALGLIAALHGGCAVSTEGDLAHDQEMETSEAAITAEVAGRAVVAARRYDDPEISRVAYASGNVDGCSATMIGPNIMMTAAHCKDHDRAMTFRTYRERSPWVSDTESFNCRTVVNTWPRSDLQLYWCDSQNGAAPGDKYGYLDLDTSVVSNQVFASVWWNSIDNLGLPDALIYSEGSVSKTGVRLWSDSFGVNGPANRPMAVALTTWGAPGASGSANVNVANHRILVGPTTLARSTATGSAYRAALPMRVYLRDATAETAANTPPFYKPGIKEATLASLGLTNTAQFYGKLDKDFTNLFDVQEALEKLKGENARSVYYLGFESERRNALWKKNAAVSFNPSAGTAVVSSIGPGQVLRHAGLNLKPNTNYRVVVRMQVSSASNPTALSILLQQPNGTLQDARFVSTLVGWNVQTAELRTGVAAVDLVLNLTGAFSGSIHSVIVVEEGASFDFDLADKRAVWTDQLGHRAQILPDGRGAGPNWAGLVKRSPSGMTWPLQSRALGYSPGVAQRVCFDAKTYQNATWSARDWATLQMVARGLTTLQWFNFTPSGVWQTFCTPAFTPPTSDNIATFDVNTEWVDGTQYAGYLVDNVRVERVTAF